MFTRGLYGVQTLYDVHTGRCTAARQVLGSKRLLTSPDSSPRGPRRALTEDQILDAALALIDEGGPHAASIRGIAARVGVAPNAVYTYFPDKAAVVRALVERLLAQVEHGDFTDPDKPWRLRVESLALDLRAQLSSHPGAVPLVIGAAMDAPHALALREHLVEVFTAAEFNPVDASRAASLLLAYAFGSVALGVAELRDPDLPPPEPKQPDGSATSIGVPSEVANGGAAATAAYLSTEQYLWGLGRVLDGMTTVFGSTEDSADVSGARTDPRPE